MSGERTGSLVMIGNPAAGRGALLPTLRGRLVDEAARLGWRAEWVETGPEPGSATRLAAEAVERGARRLLACGGDGTVHGVLQGIAGTASALGVLPLGTANALARNLRLPLEPVAALRAVLGAAPRSVPLGWAETRAGRRWFAVLAGAGPDGALVEAAAAHAGSKRRLGRSAYYARAGRLLLTRRFARFLVRYQELDAGGWQELEAVGVVAARVPSLGGLFHGLTSASRIDDPFLTVQMLGAPAHLALPAWFASTHLRLAHRNPLLRTVQVRELVCTEFGADRSVAAQVDGEAAGGLPLRLGVEPGALRLLVP